MNRVLSVILNCKKSEYYQLHLVGVGIASFPRVPLEAMVIQVPVIATTVGGLPESIENGKTGILVPPKDVDSLCNAIYLIRQRLLIN